MEVFEDERSIADNWCRALIMMTVAVMGAAYLWITSLQQSVQQTSSQQMGTIQRGQINVLSVDCNATNDIVKLVIRNIGTVTIPKGDVTMEIKDANGVHLNIMKYAMTSNFAPSSILTITYNLTDSSQSLEQKTTNLTADSMYNLQVSFPDGAAQAVSCVAHS